MIPRMSHRVLRVSLVLFAGFGAAALLAQAPAPPAAQAPTAISADERWLRAVDTWQAGSYPAALADLQTLMKSPAAAQYLDRVALLTGELYATVELTTNGRNPRISADGAVASYETGPATSPATRIVRVAAPAQALAELPTTTVAFDRGGRRVAWLRGAGNAAEIVVRDLQSGTDRVWLGAGMLKSNLAWSADDQSVIFLGAESADSTRSDLLVVREGQPAVAVTAEAGFKSAPLVDTAGVTLAYTVAAANPFAGRGAGAGRGGGGGGGRGGAAPTTYALVSLANKSTRTVAGSGLTLSANGATAAWLTREGDVTSINVLPLTGAGTAAGTPRVLRTGRERMDGLALSPSGRQLAYQLMTHTDWEIHVAPVDSADPVVHRRVTRDIQHDLLPRFVTEDTLLVLKGEARHRRSYLYDLRNGTSARLFANNTIRTVSPEYVWSPSASGTHLAVQADRDGDTVSPDRGVSVVDLTKKVTVAQVLARLDAQLAAENDLRARMTTAFKPIEAGVRRVLAGGAVNRVYEYEKALFDFDSKHITQPGNLKAIEYLEQTYRSFGYQPQLQWFTPSQLTAAKGRTANVVATLRGTVNPELIYVISSHFDSVAGGPGADDDTSGTAALLETARMLSKTPLPATVVFASFTGEEAGLLGSSEFVRLAGDAKWQIAGALNNDMIGWAADSSQINNTIRYSNAGIRDIQLGASFLFTDIVLFDAKYYQGTDAAAFYKAWGDIVGGIGSYPILANPNYHQPTDFIETMNFKQILETAKVTAATIMYLASSPSRLKDVKATRTGAGIAVEWAPSPEKGVVSYEITYGTPGTTKRARVTSTGPRATLPAVPAGTEIAVRAVNGRGLVGWDWARVTVQ